MPPCVLNQSGDTSNTIYFTVNPSPIVGPINGPLSVCVGSFITLTDTTLGGLWVSLNPNAASVDPNTGKASGVSSFFGSGSVLYSVTGPNGCTTRTLYSFTVKPF